MSRNSIFTTTNTFCVLLGLLCSSSLSSEDMTKSRSVKVFMERDVPVVEFVPFLCLRFFLTFSLCFDGGSVV